VGHGRGNRPAPRITSRHLHCPHDTLVDQRRAASLARLDRSVDLAQSAPECGFAALVQDESEALKINVSQPDNLALVTQTTLSVDDTKSIIGILKERFPNIKVPKKDDICYATQNRQDAVKQLALESDYMIVVGSKNSSNSNRLKELAEKCGCKSVLIDGFEDLNLSELDGCNRISITAGASAPEERVQEIANELQKYTGALINESGEDKENIFFKLPPLLR
jgi:4-hydroxy-3-methylbut-2-enyl diphosphate reductase